MKVRNFFITLALSLTLVSFAHAQIDCVSIDSTLFYQMELLRFNNVSETDSVFSFDKEPQKKVDADAVIGIEDDFSKQSERSRPISQHGILWYLYRNRNRK